MKNLIIRQLKQDEDMPWHLLLLADPSRDAVENYVSRNNIYLAELDGTIIGEYVLTPTANGAVELQNIAVDENYQGRGFGKQLVLDAIHRARGMGAKSIEVGTGNSSKKQLCLYQTCGFVIVGVEKDFFIRNYKVAIFENGIQCRDMVRLAISFK